MKIVLHIGWHKTGSTAIQKFLCENRKTLLDRFGVLYPETGMFTVAHHLVAWSLQEPLIDPWALSIGFHEKAEDLFSGIFHEAKTTGANTVLISSEVFVLIPPDRLMPFLKGHEVLVIVYLRRQDRAMESFYGQEVRQFESRVSLEFEQYIVRFGQGIDYKSILDKWERAIPWAIVRPIIYERSRFPQGDVVADFLAVIGLDMPVAVAAEKGNVNASLGPLSIRALARINATYQLDKEVHEEIVALLHEIDAGEDVLQAGFFNSKARIAYLKQFESNNEALFHRWLGSSNSFTLSSEELARYAAQDATMNSQAIENAVQARLRKVAEYLTNSSNNIKEHQMADQHKTSASTDKLAASDDGADKLRDAAMAAIARGEWPQALESLLEAHRLRPTGPFIRLHLAQALVELGRAAEARPHLEVIPDIPELEPLLSELRARAKGELLVNSMPSTKAQDAASTKTQSNFISSFKKFFARPRDSRKKES